MSVLFYKEFLPDLHMNLTYMTEKRFIHGLGGDLLSCRWTAVGFALVFPLQTAIRQLGKCRSRRFQRSPLVVADRKVVVSESVISDWLTVAYPCLEGLITWQSWQQRMTIIETHCVCRAESPRREAFKRREAEKCKRDTA